MFDSSDIHLCNFPVGFAGRYEQLQPAKRPRLDSEIELCGRLKHLTVYGASKEILEELLASMPHLTDLSLRPVPYTCMRHAPNVLPCILTADQKFTKLDLTSVVLLDTGFVSLIKKYAGSLIQLSVDCFELTPAAYPALSECTKVRNLYLNGAYTMQDNHLETLVRAAPGLESLYLTGIESIGDAGLAHILVLGKLRDLSISEGKKISAAALHGLGKIRCLQYLNVQTTNFHNRVLQSISFSLRDLRVLRLDKFLGVTPRSFDRICKTFTKLEELLLGSCGMLTDVDGVKLSHLKRLRFLHIYDGIGFTDKTFEEGLAAPMALEGLWMHRCALTDAGLASIAANHSRLKELRLDTCKKITADGLAGLLRREPLLEHLLLSYVEQLPATFLREIEDNTCPRLRVLRVFECCRSRPAVEEFKQRRPLVDARLIHQRVRLIRI